MSNSVQMFLMALWMIIIFNLVLCVVLTQVKSSEKYHPSYCKVVFVPNYDHLEITDAPIRSLVVAGWRTGSTFLGQILNAVPGNFYHYEPLTYIGFKRFYPRTFKAEIVVCLLIKRFTCMYYYDDDYNYVDYKWEHTQNTRLWRKCLTHSRCRDPALLRRVCKNSPTQSMKILRAPLTIVGQILYEPSLNVKIVLLIRDPRGTMQSRRHRDWCPGNPDCGLAKNLCSDMVADYHAAKKLQKQFPDRFRAIRYEDFSMDTDEGVNYLFDFYGLPVTEQVKKFLKSHTKNDKGGVSSTYRNSKQAPFHWRQDLSYDDVLGIQEDCMEALKLWDYNILTDASQLRSSEWNPISNYSITRATYL